MDAARAALRARLEEGVKAAGGVVIAEREPAHRRPSAPYAHAGRRQRGQLVQFDLAGIAVSAGSACSSGSMKPSQVLAAMGVPPDIAGCFLRVSFGPHTSEADVDRVPGRVAAHRGRAAARAA